MAFLTGQSLLMLKSQLGSPQNKDSGAVSQTDLYNQSLVSSVVQAKLLACCYGFMSEFVTSADIILLYLNTRRTASNSFRDQVGVICVKKLRFQALHVLLHPDYNIFGFIQFTVLLPHAVCKCHTPLLQTPSVLLPQRVLLFLVIEHFQGPSRGGTSGEGHKI